MSSLTKVKLSGSTDGKQIKVSGTASGSANTIHTAHATALDEVTLWADNDSTTNVDLTIEWGGTADVDNTVKVTVPGRGTAGADMPLLVIPGWALTNSLVVKAFASVTNKIKINGSVTRFTP